MKILVLLMTGFCTLFSLAGIAKERNKIYENKSLSIRLEINTSEDTLFLCNIRNNKAHPFKLKKPRTGVQVMQVNLERKLLLIKDLFDVYVLDLNIKTLSHLEFK